MKELWFAIPEMIRLWIFMIAPMFIGGLAGMGVDKLIQKIKNRGDKR